MDSHAELTLDDKRALALEPDEHDLASRLAVAVGRLNRRIRPTRDGLSHGLVGVLSTVVKSGSIRPGDLARAEGVAAPTMTRVIADLEGRGYVGRTADPSDGRSFFVSPTEAGIDAILRARFERAEHVAALLRGVAPEDRARLATSLDALEALAAVGLS